MCTSCTYVKLVNKLNKFTKKEKKIMLLHLKLDIIILIKEEMSSSQPLLKLYFSTKGIEWAGLPDYGKIWCFQVLKERAQHENMSLKNHEQVA